MAKISIKKTDLDRIIKEEALKFKKALMLKKELENVEKELNQLNENQIDEVKAGEMKEIPADTGFKGKQAKPEFHHPAKNPSTKMEENEEIEDVDLETDTEDVEDGDTINKADVLKAIEDLKMALNLSSDVEGVEDMEGSEEAGEEAGEETEEAGEEESEENSEEGEEGDEIFEFEEGEIEEYEETHQDEKGNIITAKDVTENLDEPIEGGSVAQVAKEDGVNDNMEKDTHVKAAGDTLMESEKKRMAILAGIMKG